MTNETQEVIELAQGHDGHGTDAGHAAHGAADHAADAAHDAAAHGAHGEHGEFDFLHVFHHMEDQVIFPLPTVNIGGIDIDLSITKVVIMLWLSGLISLFVFTALARNIKNGRPPTGTFANMFEGLFDFIRKDMVYALMGEKTGRRFAPYFVSLFFFILFCNLLGLVPEMATATANIGVTAGLAILTFLMIQFNAVRSQGLIPYVKHHVPPGMPVLLWPIIIPIELLGHFIRPFALTVRLFANMTGGHVVILSLFGLVFLFKSIFLAPIAIGFVVFIDFLEFLVAFIQAYVFVLLSILFVNDAVHPAH